MLHVKGRVVLELLQEVKIVLTDCDGVLTDGGMYYFDNGIEGKKFNSKYGMEFQILKNNNIDDINDLQVLKNAEFPTCLKDVQKEAKDAFKYINNKNGSEGVMRDFFESYLVIHE